MLKRLVLVFAVYAILPVNGQAQPTHTDKNGNAAEKVQQPVPPITVTVVNQPASAQEENRPKDKPDGYFHVLFSANNLPNIALCIVGGLGVWVALRTLKKIEQQTKATQDAAIATQASAEAAKGQSELTRRQIETEIERDKARLKIFPQPISVEEHEGEFYTMTTCIELTNVGQTKAHITFSAGRFVVVPSTLWPLPSPDPDELQPSTSTIEPSNDPVYAGFFFEEPYDFKSFAAEIANGDLIAYLYGIIEFENMGIERTIEFGYVWTIDTSDRNFIPQSVGELITNGEWERSLRMENRQYQRKPS